jgi:hypothetical protein
MSKDNQVLEELTSKEYEHGLDYKYRDRLGAKGP